MRRDWGDLRLRTSSIRVGMQACLRDQRDIRSWPRYAIFLSFTIWLFGHLPVTNEAASILITTPLLAFLTCGIFVVGSVLAVALGAVGIWLPGRASIVMSALAVAIAALPFA